MTIIENDSSENTLVRLIKIIWPPIVVFLIHRVVLGGLNLYATYPWIDMPMHFLGGLSIAYTVSSGLTYLQERKILLPLDPFIHLLVTLTTTVTAAVFWEFLEFLTDQIYGTNIQISLANTMHDLFFGLMGAITLIIFRMIWKGIKR
ncbi:MAG TPA: hypothetical protein VN376_08265 [Longilinea sp.]|nr:hypothetical protein [Longilinea sp.]